MRLVQALVWAIREAIHARRTARLMRQWHDWAVRESLTLEKARLRMHAGEGRVR